MPAPSTSVSLTSQRHLGSSLRSPVDHSNSRKQRGTKEPLNEGERGEASEKANLKLNIQKTNIMASSPITSWQIDGETMETDRFYFLGIQDTAAGDGSHEIKRHFLEEKV